MDKKYIHIDDLSRQVLGQREEEPRPGAWMTMRELLDKQMPVGTLPAAGFAWRRYLSAALILLLISIATIGGLHISGIMPGAGQPANDRIVAQASTPAVGHSGFREENSGREGSPEAALVSGSGVAASDNAVTAIPAASPSSTSSFAQPTESNIESAGMPAHGSHVPEVAKLPALKPVRSKAAAAPAALSVRNNKSPLAAKNSMLTKPDLKPLAMAPVSGTDNQLATASMPEATMERTEPMAAAPSAKATDRKATENKLPKAKTGKSGSNKDQSPQTMALSGTESKKVSKPAAPKKNMILVRDTIQQIQIVQRMVPAKSLRGVYEPKFDTISITDLVREKWVHAGPAYTGIGPSQDATAGRQQQVFAASAPSMKTEDGAGNYVALSSKQTSSRKWSANSITLKERMEKAMLQLSQIRAYTGMVAGVNYSTGGKLQTYGFHLGLSHAFQLDDKWTLFGEFKYHRRMGKDLILRDDYSESSSMNRSLQGGNTVYSWKTDSVEHYFKVSALQSVVVPVNLQYNLNRLFFMGGLEFSYSPRINSEEIKRNHNQPSAHSFTGNPNYNQMPPGYEAGKAGVNIDDFGGRISLGYQIGAGYELSPAIKLDVRCSQQFWDNARTPGARKVSQEFYRLPNLQLSVGYRFGKSK